MRTRRVAGIVVTLSLLGAGSALAAGPSGNAKGIALARAKHAAYGRIAAETVTETGYVSMYSVEGKVSQFSWQWGTGRVPKGWSRATEHVVAALHRGRVLWWRDDLVPPPCTAPGICTRVPVEIVVNHAGKFYAYGNAAHHTCFASLLGSVPATVGGLWDVVGGRYSAPARHGSVIVLRHTFPYTKSQTATESETVSAHSDLDLGGTLTVPAGAGGLPAFTVRFTNTQPAKAPPAPRVIRCG